MCCIPELLTGAPWRRAPGWRSCSSCSSPRRPCRGERPDNNTEFDRLSVDEGLSQVTVKTILQDRRGFMWFGTTDGLNRYDGYAFKVLKHDPTNPHGLGGNSIQILHEDAAGTCGFGTDGGALQQVRPGHRTVHTVS